MKTFTAKQFSRAPAQVFEAARENGKAEVTHDRFKGKFEIYHVREGQELIEDSAIIEIAGQKLRVIPCGLGVPADPIFLGNKKPSSEG